MDKEKEDQIREVLVYLNSRLSVMNKPQTENVRAIIEGGNVTLRDVVEWYIEAVWRSS